MHGYYGGAAQVQVKYIVLIDWKRIIIIRVKHNYCCKGQLSYNRFTLQLAAVVFMLRENTLMDSRAITVASHSL